MKGCFLMKTNMFLKARNGDYDAHAVYDDGIITVIPGSKIRLEFANYIKGGKKALSYRNNPAFVNDRGIVIKDCVFSGASTAAQFVTGQSTNGLLAWHIDQKTSLKKWLGNR